MGLRGKKEERVEGRRARDSRGEEGGRMGGGGKRKEFTVGENSREGEVGGGRGGVSTGGRTPAAGQSW